MPSSPLLFVMAIEPLAISLRHCPNFNGIVRKDTEHKVSLYADDLLLYISNPSSSVPYILSIQQTVSGYKLNLSKSEYFPVNPSANYPTSSVPFRKMSDGFKYLGIMVTRSLNALFKSNFGQLMDRCKEDFTRWSVLPLSLVGRINLIKMVTLPPFLYLFLNIHIFIKKNPSSLTWTS